MGWSNCQCQQDRRGILAPYMAATCFGMRENSNLTNSICVHMLSTTWRSFLDASEWKYVFANGELLCPHLSHGSTPGLQWREKMIGMEDGETKERCGMDLIRQMPWATARKSRGFATYKNNKCKDWLRRDWFQDPWTECKLPDMMPESQHWF